MKSKKRQNGGIKKPNLIAIFICVAVVLSLFGGGLYKLLDNQNQHTNLKPTPSYFEDIPEGVSYRPN